MSQLRRELALPPEPAELRAATRTLVEDSPERGIRTVSDGRFVADLLWEAWGDELEGAGMDYEMFLRVTRGYADELRLWVVGERPWGHCISGLAGRVLRRLPRQRRELALACSEEGR